MSENSTTPKIMIGTVDVTHAVADMYDALLSSCEWGSGFLDTEQVSSVLAIGKLMGWDEPRLPPSVVPGQQLLSRVEKDLGISQREAVQKHNDGDTDPHDRFRVRYDEEERKLSETWKAQVAAMVEAKAAGAYDGEEG
jgi:hypothetical protein